MPDLPPASTDVMRCLRGKQHLMLWRSPTLQWHSCYHGSMKLDQPFVRLPYSFDIERLQHELGRLDALSWMPHPSGMVGNWALPLVSKDGLDNNDFDGAMRPTPHLAKCPYIRQVMAHINEVYGRSRLMKLAPGSEVSPHVDFNYHWYTRVRIHVPIVTNPEVIFYCGDQALNMKAGECWIFDSWRNHRVVNSSEYDRVHLVFDTTGSSRFWQRVRASLQSPPSLLPSSVAKLEFDQTLNATVRTEHFNSAPVMSPGELEALAVDLLNDLKANPDNDPTLLRHYHVLLTDLAKDWRELWHLHGYQQSGWSAYKQLLDDTVVKLAPSPRALVTASNDIGANPIIMQRILRAALRVDLLDQFVS